MCKNIPYIPAYKYISLYFMIKETFRAACSNERDLKYLRKLYLYYFFIGDPNNIFINDDFHKYIIILQTQTHNIMFITILI